ncbi:MAG TPA: nitrate- and nitrite sensing domain-containing protein [Streptosporangiaceae bacterium]
MTVPLVALIGLVAYVATTTANNAIDLDRVPSLIRATSEPAANFTALLQEERVAAVAYLFDPTSPSAASAFTAATKATKAGQTTLLTALNSPKTKGAESGAEASGITALEAQLGKLPQLEAAVLQSQLTPIQAYGAYTQAIAAEPQLFLDEADTETNATAADQALGLIAAVSSQEALFQEDALLTGMLIAPKSTTAQQRTDFAQARAAFDISAANRNAYVQDTNFLLTPANQKVYNGPQASAGDLLNQLQQVETAVETGTDIDKLGLTPSQWETMAGSLLTVQSKGGFAEAAAQLAADQKIATSAWIKFWLVSGIALAALLLTILFSIVLGRTIIRRLRGLEQTALTLAEQQLPDVVSRLRRGDDVDVATEAPPLRIGDDEIGRVGQAFDLVRQTAIRSAVEEAKLRRGLNDVFRSLARRSQSLLHRQLTLLDQMERRASDPEALDDLFRLDHLTTRMRRHAEGLIILAGAPPGRGWSSPVRMLDVMRGAIAEVEDYARVSVATRSQAALSGSAVADVIHLLAELVENATTLSPPYTSVRVSGDTVANGFAIEVEDRGLGMSMQRINELNDRLANPPEFNPSDSEQLGLFVVGQLARRHGIKVTLKSSPYGGTEAVVLIPRQLVVTEEAFRASLPGEHAAAITMGAAASVAVDDGSEVLEGQPSAPDRGSSRLFPLDAESQLLDRPSTVAGPRIAGPLRRTQGGLPEGMPRGGHHAPPRGGAGGLVGAGANGSGLTDSNGSAGNGLAGNGSGGNGPASNGNEYATEPGQDGPDSGELPRRTRTSPADRTDASAWLASEPATGSAFDVFSPLRRSDGQPEPRPGGQEGPRPGSQEGPRPEGQAESRASGSQATAPYADAFPDQPPAFPAWAAPSGQPAGPAGPHTQFTPVASPPGGAATSRPPWDMPGDTSSQPAAPAATEPAATEPAAEPAATEPESPDGDGLADDDDKDLPRRVKQASIAPQLRGDLADRRRRTAPADTGANAATIPGPTPDEIRATMSALQRGWQEGRSQRPGGGEPSWGQNAEGD